VSTTSVYLTGTSKRQQAAMEKLNEAAATVPDAPKVSAEKHKRSTRAISGSTDRAASAAVTH